MELGYELPKDISQGGRMKRVLLCVLVFVLAAACVPAVHAQWRCNFATYDSETNGTGSNTPAVGVIKDGLFVALVARLGATGNGYFVPYVNADSSTGRVYYPGYDQSLIYDLWSDGAFDQDFILNCLTMVAMPDSFLYLANNGPEHAILVFKFIHDTVTVVPVGPSSVYPRQVTGNKGIFGIAVDNAGYVYVCNDTSAGVTDDIKIYKPISQWTISHNDASVRTVDLPDGIYKGLCVSPTGSMLFVSDYMNRRVVKYVGSPTTGYTKDNTFDFTMAATDTVPVTTTLRPGPIGMAYLSPNNILAVACDVWGNSASTNGTYSYGRIYLLNPKTGALISPDSSVSVIDQAAWNLAKLGSYTNRGDGTSVGNASGYTSTWCVAWDQNKNLYSQSNFGWTVEKWSYTGTLPTIPLTSVEPVGDVIPRGYELRQNFPNPFNPTTSIQFSSPSTSHVSLVVHDMLGREVATLLNEVRGAGTYRVIFEAQGLPSGSYVYTINAGGFRETKRMVLVK
jgi:hypothetical protein